MMEGTGGHDSPLENEGHPSAREGIDKLSEKMTTTPGPEQISGTDGHGVAGSPYSLMDQQGLEDSLEGDMESLNGRIGNNGVQVNQIHSSEEKTVQGSHGLSSNKDISDQTRDSSLDIPKQSHELSTSRDLIEGSYIPSVSVMKENLDSATFGHKQETPTTADREEETALMETRSDEDTDSEHWETASEESAMSNEGIEPTAHVTATFVSESETDGKGYEGERTETNPKETCTEQPCEDAGHKNPTEVETDCKDNENTSQHSSNETVGDVTEANDWVANMEFAESREEVVKDYIREAIGEGTEADIRETVGEGTEADIRETVGEGTEADIRETVGEGTEADIRETVGEGTEADIRETVGEGTEADIRETVGEGTEADSRETVGEGTEADSRETVGEGTEADSRETVGEGTEADSRETVGEGTEADSRETVGEGTEADSRETVGEGTEADSRETVGEGTEADSRETVGEGTEADSRETVGEGTEADSRETVGEGTEADSRETVGEGTEADSRETVGEGTEADSRETVGEGTEADSRETVGEGTEADSRVMVGEGTEADSRETVGEMTEADRQEAVREMTEADGNEMASNMTVADGDETVGEMTEADRREVVGEMTEADSVEAVIGVNETGSKSAVGEVTDSNGTVGKVVIKVVWKSAGEVTKGNNKEAFRAVTEPDISNNTTDDKITSAGKEMVRGVNADNSNNIMKDEPDCNDSVEEKEPGREETVREEIMVYDTDLEREETRAEGEDTFQKESGIDGNEVDGKETMEALTQADVNKAGFDIKEPIGEENDADYEETVRKETLVYIKDTVEIKFGTSETFKDETDAVIEGIHEEIEDETVITLTETGHKETVHSETSEGMYVHEDPDRDKHPVCEETCADHVKKTNQLLVSEGKGLTRPVGTRPHETAKTEETDEEILDDAETALQAVATEQTEWGTDQLEESNTGGHSETATAKSSELHTVTEPVPEERAVKTKPIASAEREDSETMLSFERLGKGTETSSDNIMTDLQQTSAEQCVADFQYPTGNTDRDSSNKEPLMEMGQEDQEGREPELENTVSRDSGSNDSFTVFKLPEMGGDRGNLTEVIDQTMHGDWRTAQPSHPGDFFVQALSRYDFADLEPYEASTLSDTCVQINISEDDVIERDDKIDPDLKNSDGQSLPCVQDSVTLENDNMTPMRVNILSGSQSETENLTELDDKVHVAGAHMFMVMKSSQIHLGMFDTPDDVSTSIQDTRSHPVLQDRALKCLQEDHKDMSESESMFANEEMENLMQNDTLTNEPVCTKGHEDSDRERNDSEKSELNTESGTPTKHFFEVDTDLNVTTSTDNMLHLSNSLDTPSRPVLTTNKALEASRTPISNTDVKVMGGSKAKKSDPYRTGNGILQAGLTFFPMQISNPMLLLGHNSEESSFYDEGSFKDKPKGIPEEEDFRSTSAESQFTDSLGESFDSNHSKKMDGQFVSPLWLPPRPFRYMDNSGGTSAPAKPQENTLVRRATIRSKRGNRRDSNKRFGALIPPALQGSSQVARTGSPELPTSTRSPSHTGTLTRQNKISEDIQLAPGHHKNVPYMEKLIEEPVGKEMDSKLPDPVVLREKGFRSRSPLSETLRNTHRRHSKLIHSSNLLYQEYSDVALNQEIQRQKPQETPSEEKDPGSPRLRRRLLSSQESYLQRLSVSSADSLWQDIPLIRGSSALMSMTRDEQKLQEARFELITSEALYVRSLNIAVDHFQRNAELQEILSAQERQWLFSRLSEVRDASSDFLFDLEEEFENDMYNFQVCNVAINHVPNFRKVYLPYVTNQCYQERTFQSLLSHNPRFQQVLGRLESDPVCQRLSLKSFLILPFQRITRLRLLLQNILKRSAPGSNEELQATEAHNGLEELIRDCNQNVQRMKNTEDLIHLNQKIQFECKIFPLISQSRRLVKHGEVSSLELSSPSFKWKLTAKPVYLHLFNDCLMLSRLRDGGRFVVFDYALFPDVRVERCEMKIHGSQKNIFRVFLRESASVVRESAAEGKETEYIFRTETQSQKLRWILALSPAKEETDFLKCHGLSQMQCLKSYKAKENDELSLEKADVILVTQHSEDGWLHGLRLSDMQSGWFPQAHVQPISRHACIRNLQEEQRLQTARAKMQPADAK